MFKFVSKSGVQTFKSLDEIPYKVIGYSENNTEKRNKGMCVPRAELDNQPMFEGFVGPMWDGGVLRYETQEVYDMFWD